MRRLIVLVMLLGLLAGVVSAQTGGTLTYGASIVGRVTIQNPFLFYNFEGEAGDIVVLRALSMTPGLRTSLTVIDTAQNVVASSSDVIAPPDAIDSALTLTLPESGLFSVQVGVGDGEFLLQIERRVLPDDAETLPVAEAVALDLPADGSMVQRLATPDAECPTTLTVAASGADGAQIAGRVLGADGALVSQFAGSGLDPLALDSDNAPYLLQVVPLYAGQAATALAWLACADAALPAEFDAAPLIPLAAPTFAPPAGSFMMIQPGGMLSYSQGLSAQVMEGSPLTGYTFSGTEGDIITVDALAISPGLDLNVAVLAPNMQPIAFNENAPFAFTPTDASATVRLGETGQFTILVGYTGMGGGYVVRLNGVPGS
ncbi:MAG: hypothetical protein KME04_13505 [Pleurocapsa minor GSE-CHR-MK-17-07R]|nr:hypothetical protein [Pleurocapsa minor GSE-CHR-MK 17-07R]